MDIVYGVSIFLTFAASNFASAVAPGYILLVWNTRADPGDYG